MAVLFVTEYWRLATEGGGTTVLAGLEPSKTQTVAIGAGSTQATLATETRFVRLHTDAICHVVFGPNPTATTSAMRLAANQTEFFGTPQGALKLAVIQGV